MEPPGAAWDSRAVDTPPPMFSVLVISAFMSESVLALMVANSSFLATRQSRTSHLLAAAAAIMSSYPSNLSTVPEGIIASSAGSVVEAAVLVGSTL